MSKGALGLESTDRLALPVGRHHLLAIAIDDYAELYPS